MSNKIEYINVRASIEEIEAFEYLADINGMTVSDYLRSLVIEKLEEEGYRG